MLMPIVSPFVVLIYCYICTLSYFDAAVVSRSYVVHSKAVLPLRRRDCDSIKKKALYSRLLVEPSVPNGASPTSATTIR
jgi:hypothetical protein